MTPAVEVALDGHRCLHLDPPGAHCLYVLAHGAGAGMRHAFMTEIAVALAAHGVATLRWEFPYMAANRPRTDRAPVAEAAVQAIWTAARTHHAALPMFAGGKSFGGRMSSRAHASAPLAGCRGLVFLGFPLHPPEQPEKAVERAEHLPRTTGPLLFLQGTRDELADLALLRPVVKQLGRRAKLAIIDGADHGFDVLVRSGRTHPEVMTELASTIAGWTKKICRG